MRSAGESKRARMRGGRLFFFLQFVLQKTKKGAHACASMEASVLVTAEFAGIQLFSARDARPITI